MVQTAKQKQLLKKNYGLESIVLQNSHPIPIVKNSKRENAIIWVANMRDFKRAHLFIELTKRLADYGIKCRMIGAVTREDFKRELLSMQREYNNFYYLGVLSVEQVYHYLQESKIFVNTSTEEGFPNTFIQAWLSGLPVVTLGVDPSGIIKNYKLGIVAKSIEEMKDVILQILNNESLWKQYSERSKQFASAHFDINAYVQKFLRITGIEI